MSSWFICVDVDEASKKKGFVPHNWLEKLGECDTLQGIIWISECQETKKIKIKQIAHLRKINSKAVMCDFLHRVLNNTQMKRYIVNAIQMSKMILQILYDISEISEIDIQILLQECFH